MARLHALLAVVFALASAPVAAADYPKPVEGDWTAKAFELHTGTTGNAKFHAGQLAEFMQDVPATVG